MSNPDQSAIRQRLEGAREFARLAGEVTLRYFMDPALTIEHKPDGTPVTPGDRETETELRRLIAGAFPDDAIAGEEFEDKEGDSGYRWILDPIDGTKSFMRGVPLYGTLVGVEHVASNQVVAGVIRMPALSESVSAGLGLGALHERAGMPGVPARVSDTPSLDKSLLCITWLATHGETFDDSAIRRLIPKVGMVRGWTDCYAHVLVATGRADLVVEPVVAAWDVAPMAIILPEAGGRFGDFSGRSDIRAGNAFSCNASVYEELLGTFR